MDKIIKLLENLKELDYAYYGYELDKIEANIIIESLEKQIPMKSLPQYEEYKDYSICPKCYGTIFSKENYCSQCGQRVE